jgi:hypothetical protein
MIKNEKAKKDMIQQFNIEFTGLAVSIFAY